MSGSKVVRAAIFTAGALVGGGVTAFVNRRHARPTTAPVPPGPIVEVNEGRHLTLAGGETLLSPVLKYGNPGKSSVAAAYHLFDSNLAL